MNKFYMFFLKKKKKVQQVSQKKKKFYIFVITMQSLNGQFRIFRSRERSESRVKLVRSGHNTV